MAQTVKNLPAVQEAWVRSLGGEDPLEEGMETQSSSCLENPHGQRSLEGYSPWDPRESDRTERLTLSLFHFQLAHWVSGDQQGPPG